MHTDSLAIIEDNQMIRSSLAALLEMKGWTVRAYETAEAADELLRDDSVAVALIDVRLPGRQGDSFARELVERRPAVRVIFVTAEYDVAHLLELVPSATVLRKPFSFEQLERELDH